MPGTWCRVYVKPGPGPGPRGVVRACLTSLGLVESVHGHQSTKLIGHLSLINQYQPTFNVAGTSWEMWGPCQGFPMFPIDFKNSQYCISLSLIYTNVTCQI